MLTVIGFNHNNTELAIREQLVFDASQLKNHLYDWYQQLNQNVLAQHSNLAGLIIVSTCNRTEFYMEFFGEEDMTAVVLNWLATQRLIKIQTLEEHHYSYNGDKAIAHLFSVISGIDSMVLGETQIAGQMKYAYHMAQQAATLSGYLNRLFQYAFSVGKQIRTQTMLGENPVSIASIAVKLSQNIFEQLHNKTLLLVGAGEMIELVAKHFIEQLNHSTVRKYTNFSKIIIANRTLQHATVLANQFQGEAIHISELPNTLHCADIIVSSTASQLPIIGKGIVETVMKRRKYKTQLMIDLAVPRDIEPEVNTIDNIYLFSIDDLQTVANDNLGERLEAADKAKTIAQQSVIHWNLQQSQRYRENIIKLYREQALSIRDEMVQKSLKQLTNEDSEVIIKRLAQQLTNKLIHPTTDGLKQIGNDLSLDEITRIKSLLGLDNT